MVYAVFLCDKEWKIKRIRQCTEMLRLEENEDLTQMVEEAEELTGREEEQFSLALTFPAYHLKASGLIHCFKEGNLVVLVRVRDDREFLEVQNAYPKHLEWAKDYLVGLYHDEYFQIQQINNQLIDAQRALVCSNRKLENALQENREANERLEAARQAAERAMERADEANRSKTSFLANMSHDIRTPMNAIIGITELMEHHLREPEMLENYIAKLKSSSQYLLDLINDILDLSKMESNSLELKIEPMDLGIQMEQIITIIRAQAADKKQNLKIQIEQLQDRYVMGDAVRLRQMLINILSNAVKYTPDGGEICFSVQKLTEDAGQMAGYRFCVRDTGIGMSPEFKKHIFEPFSRAEAVTGEIQGTGLGMAITKNIVDAMGGTIRVDSEQGKGSRFEIELVFQKSRDSGGRKDSGSLDWEKKDAEKEVPALGGMSFLCAEDNELNAEILSSMLELAGASCTVYPNGKQITDAFEQVKPGEYDAVLMDVQMPVMNGYEATRRIRNGSNPVGKTIPIIAMTANAFSEDIQKSLEAGMNAHISKPIELGVLEQVMKEILQRRRNQ